MCSNLKPYIFVLSLWGITYYTIEEIDWRNSFDVKKLASQKAQAEVIWTYLYNIEDSLNTYAQERMCALHSPTIIDIEGPYKSIIFL